MGASTEKVRNYIPDDIVFSVFSKLSLKSVKRFECGCKSWAILFENPYFMRIFCNNFLSNHHSYYDDTSLLLYTSSHDLYLLSGEMYENRVKLAWPDPLQQEDPYVYLLDSGSITGIICLYKESKSTVVLWNPATEVFRIIPPSPLESVPVPPCHVARFILHGFGYDHVTDDYKLIRTLYYYTPHGVECKCSFIYKEYEIYSLRNNSWRQIDGDVHKCSGLIGSPTSERVYTAGMCHWWGYCANTTHESRLCLTSFDLSNEVFLATPIPSNIADDIPVHLVLLNGSIALITWWNFDMPTFYLSILGEIGVKESWTKLFTVGPWSGIERLIATGKKGDIFFRKEDGELVWFNLSTQLIKELGIKEEIFSNILIYKENLLQL